ncbi:hypothetical protein TNCV_3083101 [Trichonephila clavipes]|nr:hypothetical protein TNCV_3083101 [Trichonephila clavipes]
MSRNSSKNRSIQFQKNFNSLPFSFHADIMEVKIEVVSPSIIPSGNFAELNCTVPCMVLKANRRTPCHDEFRGPRSNYVRQVALETTTINSVGDYISEKKCRK